MIKRVLFGLIWVGFISYAFVFAPPDQPDTFELIKNLSLGRWEGINPLVIALFNLMGILPLIYASILVSDGREQKVKSSPFVIGSFFLGAFALLPYLIIRNTNPNFTGEKDLLLRILDSRLTAILITIGAVILLIFGFSQGNIQNFIEQWQTNRFIHVMSLDFCLLSCLFIALIGDDLARRGVNIDSGFWRLSYIPFLGGLGYLCFRPSLPENEISP